MASGCSRFGSASRTLAVTCTQQRCSRVAGNTSRNAPQNPSAATAGDDGLDQGVRRRGVVAAVSGSEAPPSRGVFAPRVVTLRCCRFPGGDAWERHPGRGHASDSRRACFRHSFDPESAVSARLNITPVGAFVGRDSELSALAEYLEHALGGRASLVLCRGEPAIGKTRLAEELSLLAATASPQR